MSVGEAREGVLGECGLAGALDVPKVSMWDARRTEAQAPRATEQGRWACGLGHVLGQRRSSHAQVAGRGSRHEARPTVPSAQLRGTQLRGQAGCLQDTWLSGASFHTALSRAQYANLVLGGLCLSQPPAGEDGWVPRTRAPACAQL